MPEPKAAKNEALIFMTNTKLLPFYHKKFNEAKMCENPTPFLPEYWQLDDMDQLKSMIGSLISEWFKHRIVDTKVAGTSQRIESTRHPKEK